MAAAVLFELLFFSSTASAAPNIVSQNLTGVGTFTPGQVITFSANTTNVGTDMDTTNSHRFRSVRALTEVGGVNDYVIKGNYLYAGSDSSRQLYIYNVSNLENPVLVNTYTIPSIYSASSGIYELELYGNYLVVGGYNVNNYEDIVILNITDPVTPSVTQSLPSSGECGTNDIEGMKVLGNKLYFRTGSRFCVFDISNPSSPAYQSYVSVGGAGGPLDVQGNYAYALVSPVTYAVGEFKGIRVIDVSNPSSISVVGEITLNVNTGSASHNVVVRDNYVYVGGHGTADLSIVDVSNPTSPALASQLDFAIHNTNWISGSGLSLNYPYLYVANGTGFVGINSIDVSNALSPVLKGHVNGPATDVTGFNQNYVFGSGYSASSLTLYKPYVQGRFCIDNPTCETGGSVLKTATSDPLASGGTFATSTTWVATLGTHTITYCSDFKDTYGFDGVSESNESDNCSSYTFVVSNPLPPTATIEAQVNGGAWSAADVTVNPGDTINIRWSSTNATACTGTGSGFSTGNAVSGSDTTITLPSPGTTGSYAVSCTGPGGTGADTLAVTVRQRPNFTAPIFSSPSFGAFNGITGTYDSVTITMQTSNNGGSASLVNAPYEVLVDGVLRSTGSIAPLGAGGFSNQNLVVPGPIPIGTVVIQAEIDKGNAVTETNESDNVGSVSLSVPAANPGISLSVLPTQVQNNQTATISWNVANPYPMNCSVFGPNMTTVTFNPSVNGASGSATTGPINAKSVYTISCDVAGTKYTQTGTVETQGILEEV